MLKPAVYLLMTILLDRAFGQTFKCFPNQTIHFENPDSSIYTHFVAFYDVGSVVTKCIGTSDSTKNNIYFDCASTTATVTAYFSDRSLSGDILGGKDTLACTLRCTPINAYIATISSNVDYSTGDQSKTEQLLTPTFDITDDIITQGLTNSLTDHSFTTNVSETAVGDVVFLLISSPAEYDVIPLSCNATGSGGDSVTVTNDCSFLSSPMIIKVGSVVSMCNNMLYIYKFYSPDMLVVECDVIVCLNGSYPTICNSDRERRAIKDAFMVKDADADIKRIHVTKRWTIKDRAFGGADHITGSFTLTLTLMFLVGIFNIGKNGACASKPCGANSTCVKNGETLDCKGFRKPGCRKIIPPEHGYVVREISGTTQPFGHKVYVGCVWPYVSLWLRYDHHAMSVCLQTGAWSWPTENCYRVTDVCYFFNDETQASGLMDFVSHTDLAGETTFNNWPGWRPGPVSDRPWLKMRFQGTYWVGGISTRGHPATSEWVQTYKLAYNIDEGCGSWNYYNEQPANTVTKIFEANTDGVTWKENLLEPPVKAKCFRFNL